MLGAPNKDDEVHLTAAQSSNSPVLCLEKVDKRFGGTAAVNGLDLEIYAGEIVSLIGPSGCGKTTTLRLIAGLEHPDSGSVYIAGDECQDLSPEHRRAGFVFQDLALFPHLTVAQNVAFGLLDLRPSERSRRVREILEMVDLASCASRLPQELSGGQQQRVALARALAPGPALLLLDEPLSNLDPQLRRQVRHDVVSIIRDAGTAALWVTHDHDEGLIISDRVVVMKEGRAVQTGTPAEVWRSPRDAWVARFIGSGDVLTGTVESGKVHTLLGSVLAPGWPDGADAQVLVRPEDVGFHPDGYPGRVVRRHFSGLDSIYCVQLEHGQLLHCRQPSDVEIPRGSRVTVRLAKESLPLLS